MLAKENIGLGRVENLLEDRSDRDDSARKSLADQVIGRCRWASTRCSGDGSRAGWICPPGNGRRSPSARAYMRDAQVMILDEPTASSGRSGGVRSVPTLRRLDSRKNGRFDFAQVFDSPHGRPHPGARAGARSSSRGATTTWFASAAGMPSCSSYRRRGTGKATPVIRP